MFLIAMLFISFTVLSKPMNWYQYLFLLKDGLSSLHTSFLPFNVKFLIWKWEWVFIVYSHVFDTK